jgi:excisionase family DNA binding protein
MHNDILRAALTQAASQFLNTPEAAAYLRLSRRTLEKMRSIGGGPRYRKHGRYVRYHIDDLDKWSTSRTQSSTSERARNVPQPNEDARPKGSDGRG